MRGDKKASLASERWDSLQDNARRTLQDSRRATVWEILKVAVSADYTAKRDEITRILDEAPWAQRRGETAEGDAIYWFVEPEAESLTVNYEEIPEPDLTAVEEPALRYPKPANKEDQALVEVLLHEFPKGLRTDYIDLNNLRRKYHSTHGEALTENDETLTARLKRLCIVHDERAYHPETLVTRKVAKQILSHLAKLFKEGRPKVHLAQLHQEFEGRDGYSTAMSPDLLKEWIPHVSTYRCKGIYVSEDGKEAKTEPVDEIRDVLLQYDRAISNNILYKALPHLTSKQIKRTLLAPEFVCNGTEEHFHYSLLGLGEDEVEGIASLIGQLLDTQGYLGGRELREALEDRYGYLVERLAWATEYGLRDAIRHYMGDRFSFEGNIISRRQDGYTEKEVFAKFARDREQFTLAEVLGLQDRLSSHGRVAWDEIYANSLRVDRDNFVAPSRAAFDIKATDDALERICTEHYIGLGEAMHGLPTLPYAGYPWNPFLLEHYVANWSKRFQLLHVNSFNQDVTVGAIVRRKAGITTFEKLVEALLIENPDIELTEQAALEYLVEKGYLNKKRFSKLNEILRKAKARRKGRR